MNQRPSISIILPAPFQVYLDGGSSAGIGMGVGPSHVCPPVSEKYTMISESARTSVSGSNIWSAFWKRPAFIISRPPLSSSWICGPR